MTRPYLQMAVTGDRVRAIRDIFFQGQSIPLGSYGRVQVAMFKSRDEIDIYLRLAVRETSTDDVEPWLMASVAWDDRPGLVNVVSYHSIGPVEDES